MGRKSLHTTVNLTDEQKKQLMEEIRLFFEEELGEDIGFLRQQKVLDLFLEQLAPAVYNKALDDAMYWYKRQQDNLEADFYALYKESR